MVERAGSRSTCPPKIRQAFAGSRLSYQLQLLFYLLAAERIVPGAVVSDAFLDFVDPGRRINFDTADL